LLSLLGVELMETWISSEPTLSPVADGVNLRG